MLADIESLGYPLVFKAGSNDPAPPGLDVLENNIAIRTEVRALTGMQKEALVYYGPTGTTWRMVSDEGPYLNGTDLAPFPLAFFTTGMALSFVDELQKHAKQTGVTIRDYQLTIDNFYTMEGSAIRGDMIGGALPAEMLVEIEADAAADAIRKIVNLAQKTSPAQAIFSQELMNTFALTHNGRFIAVPDVTPSPGEARANPISHFENARPLNDDSYVNDIIVKVQAADAVIGVEGGAGSSLKATQKRTLHVHGICTPGENGLQEVNVKLFKPLGSSFRFVGDNSDQERAPGSLAYLAAGIGFCFMTQIGRYAFIVKQELKNYSIVQDTIFWSADNSSKAEPVDTHVFQESTEPDKAVQKTLYMSERTCFLHAAMRDSIKAKITTNFTPNPY